MIDSTDNNSSETSTSIGSDSDSDGVWEAPVTDYYSVIEKHIRDHYNQYTGDQNAYAVSSLLLIDHRLVTRWIDGIPHYAYITVSNKDLWVVYKRKNSAHMSKDIRQIPVVYQDAPLKEFLTRYESIYHLKEWATIDELLPNIAQVVPNSVVFDCCLKDLDAISLFTTEYRWISRIAMDLSYASEHSILGIVFPATVPSKFLPARSFASWLKLMYYDYMLMSNLELLEYYVRNSRRSRGPVKFSTVYHFTEFVPCMLQFSGVFNPILTEGMVPVLKTYFPKWVDEMLSQTEAPGISGSRVTFEETDKVAVYYTTRASVEKITGYSAAPNAGRAKSNVYSPRYFMGQVYAALWGPQATEIRLPKMFYSCSIRWYYLVVDDKIRGFSPNKITAPNGAQCFDCSFGEMLFIEMLASVYGFNSYAIIQRLMPAYRSVSIDSIKKAGILDEE